MTPRWQRTALVLGLALAATSGVPAKENVLPSLSLAGHQATRRIEPAPSLGVTRHVGLSEAQVRAEVIRRLEARIRRRKETVREPQPRRSEPPPVELAALQSKVNLAVRRARDLPESTEPESEAPEADYPPEEAPEPRSRGFDREIPRGPTGIPQGFVSPEQVREKLPWAPPERLRTLPRGGAGREVGILPPEVTGEPTPPRNPTGAATPRAREHTLARGETLWSLARRYGVTVQDLIRANAIADVDDLSVGALLTIPDPGAPAPRKAFRPVTAGGPVRAAGTYRVVRGDSLYKIARTHQVTVDEMLRANPRISAEHLSPGMELVIPDPRVGGPTAPVQAVNRMAPQRAVARRAPVPVPLRRPAPPVAAPAPAAPRRRIVSTASGSARFSWPISGTVTAGFGWKSGKPHTGVDISAHVGTVIRAAAAGKVIFSGQMRDYGNVVILDHQDGFFTVYGHNERNLVKKGGSGSPTMIRAGQAIARVGATGEAVAPQLHFEVRKLNQAVDPLRYLAPRQARSSRSVLPGRP